MEQSSTPAALAAPPRPRIKTTIPVTPLPPLSEREPIKTARLILRPLVHDDMPAFHSMRSDPESMMYSSAGRADLDMAETTAFVSNFMTPLDAETYVFAITLASSGEFVGFAGVVRLNRGIAWPEVGYFVRRDLWGGGYASECMRGFLEAWARLPRQTVETEIEALFLGGGVAGSKEGEVVPEQVMARAHAVNLASVKVMEKAGFKKLGGWSSSDSAMAWSGPPAMLICYSGNAV